MLSSEKNACTLNDCVIQKQFLKLQTIQGLFTNKPDYPRVMLGRKLRLISEKLDFAASKNIH